MRELQQRIYYWFHGGGRIRTSLFPNGEKDPNPNVSIIRVGESKVNYDACYRARPSPPVA